MKLLTEHGLAVPLPGKEAVGPQGAVKLRLDDKLAGRFTMAQLYGMSPVIRNPARH